MDNRPILFLDSGIGGLPYCQHFHHHNPHEALVYCADREHFPYGRREREELIALLSSLVARLRGQFNPKLGVIACNTATVSALASLRETFPDLPLVGTVPAVKPAVLASKRRHIGVLGTDRTIRDPYIAELAARFGPDCAVTALAAPDLVDFVEHRYALAGEEERRSIASPYIEEFRRAGADAIVLGCTHFLFLLDDFKALAKGELSIHDSIAGVSRRAEALLDQGGLRAGVTAETSAAEGPAALLLVTGLEPLEPVWEERAQAFGLTLCAGNFVAKCAGNLPTKVGIASGPDQGGRP
ncbi:glutamate racemase [Treponema primitia ZAS-2]|uniref:Glutamate racemase n=1 Tax=Treponema primitia (strain ATCC BAA-887 / DSM 12427 / ZAS-2) TaxID=545694 RepID=F5YIG1_TREPZ|nr:glutamate racemase [Treponema primitia]AEF84925.1 glutamate racemase [Treponema primitia ZAS-2]